MYAHRSAGSAPLAVDAERVEVKVVDIRVKPQRLLPAAGPESGVGTECHHQVGVRAVQREACGLLRQGAFGGDVLVVIPRRVEPVELE